MSNSHSHNLGELRGHLFATLAALRDKENPMEIDRARAVCAVAKEITDTARIEIDYQRVTGNEIGSQFIESPAPAALPKHGSPAQLTDHNAKTINHPAGSKATHVQPVPGGTITTHRIR